MPWTSRDVKKHTSKARSAKRKRQWLHVANGAKARGASDESAIRQANAVVSGKRKKAKPKKRKRAKR